MVFEQATGCFTGAPAKLGFNVNFISIHQCLAPVLHVWMRSQLIKLNGSVDI